MNESYKKIIEETKSIPGLREGEPIGAYVNSRLKHILDLVDFDDLKVILDLGSRNAVESIEFAHTFPEAKIYGFEAAPRNIARCEEYLNRFPNVKERIYQNYKAVSNKTEKIKFYPIDEHIVHNPNFGIGSMFKLIQSEVPNVVGENWIQEEVEVEAIRLDQWQKENNIAGVDLIWMDIQGAELLALQGMGETLKNVKVIMTEVGIKPYYEGHTLKPEIEKLIGEFGFFGLPESVISGHSYEADIIYVNKNWIKPKI